MLGGAGSHESIDALFVLVLVAQLLILASDVLTTLLTLSENLLYLIEALLQVVPLQSPLCLLLFVLEYHRASALLEVLVAILSFIQFGALLLLLLVETFEEVLRESVLLRLEKVEFG